jgi:cystathionine beta-synthase
MKGDKMVGSVSENTVLNFILENPLNHAEKPVSDIMDDAFPLVEEELPISKLNKFFNKKTAAVMARDKAGKTFILTKYDILQMI